MVIGGLKHQSQVFNYRSAGITATLLFVSVAGKSVIHTLSPCISVLPVFNFNPLLQVLLPRQSSPNPLAA